MKFKIFILIFLSSINYLYSSSTRFVNNGAQILDFDIGAREKSLGGAFTGTADDPNTIFYNTAGIADSKKLNLSVSHFSLFQELSIQSFAVNYPLFYGNIGVGLNYFHTGEFAQIINGAETANKIFYSSLYGIVGYGASILNNLQAGIGIKYIYNNIGNITGNAFAVDVGLLYGTEIFKFYNKVENNFRIGLSAQNFGTKIKYISKSEKLPQKIRLGIYYKPLQYIAASFEGNYWPGYDFKDAISVKTGIEILPEYFITPRIGLAVENNEIEFSAGMGVGLKMESYNYRLDMSYVGNSFLGSSLYFTFTISPKLFYLYRKSVILNSNYIPDFSIIKIRKKTFFTENNNVFPVKVLLIKESSSANKDLKIINDNLFEKLKQNLIDANIELDNTSPDISVGIIIKKVKSKYLSVCNIIDINKHKVLKKINIKFKSKKSTGKLAKILTKKILELINLNCFTILRITSIPEPAEIYLNDKFIGTTPLKTKIKKQKYDVLVKSEGYKILKRKINLFNSNNFDFEMHKIYKSLENFDVRFTATSTNILTLTKIEALKFMIKDSLKENKYVTFDKKFSPDLIIVNTVSGNNISVLIKDTNKNQTVFSNIYNFSSNNDYILITDKIKSFVVNYINNIKNKYQPVYYKHRDGYIKFYSNNKKVKYKIVKFNEVYNNNEIVKLKLGTYNISILNEKNKTVYTKSIKIAPNKTNFINYIPEYKDTFFKPEFSFWKRNNYIGKNILYKKGLVFKSENSVNRIILESKKILVRPFSAEIKFKIKQGQNFYFIITDKNNDVFIKYTKKGYYFVKREKGKDYDIPVTMLTKLKNENKKYHTFKIIFKNNNIAGYIDDIKIDELPYYPEEYIKVKMIGTGKNFIGEFKDFIL